MGNMFIKKMVEHYRMQKWMPKKKNHKKLTTEEKKPKYSEKKLLRKSNNVNAQIQEKTGKEKW